MTSTPYPEEIECYRMPIPEGRFSNDKRYEYTYATRKSWEYIPTLGRKEWRYFTNKAFLYAGKWLRSEQRGFGDGGDYWEVFLDDRHAGKHGRDEETIVSWDYDGMLCWRECPYTIDDKIINNVVHRLVDEMITTVVEKTPRVPPLLHDSKPNLVPNTVTDKESNWSLLRCIFGSPSKCGPFDAAEVTTMEPKYHIHKNIAEFWCFITSFFYGTCLFLYFVKEEDWFEEWRQPITATLTAAETLCTGRTGWPVYIHFSIIISVLVMICSAFYHARLFEVAGCIDCFLASFVFASVTMTTFGIDILTQCGVLLGIGVLNLNAWRYSTRIAIIIVSIVYPFALLSCARMKSYYGRVVFGMTSIGLLCFLLDRMGYAPLHSIWHILGGCAITLSLYYVIVNGTIT